MTSKTNISWTGFSWNPVAGCTVHSAGCTNCYAMKMAHRLQAMGTPVYQGLTKQTKAGPVWTGKLALNEHALLDPLRRKKPTTYFVNSMSDLFHEDMADEWIDRVFAVMALAPQHTFQVLTKRSDRMREYLTADRWQERLDWQYDMQAGGLSDSVPVGEGWPLPNVWLGVSVEDQRAADERIPDLLATPAAVRWISAEPLLGPVDLTRIMHAGAEECFHTTTPPFKTLTGSDWTETRGNLNALTGHYWGEDKLDGLWKGWCGEEKQPSPGLGSPGYYLPIDWVVAGGESGPNARPMHPDWARSLRDQCAAAGVPFHFKQWGEWFPYGAIDANGHQNSVTKGERSGVWHDWGDGEGFSVRLGKKWAGRFLDGVLHDAMPGAVATSGEGAA